LKYDRTFFNELEKILNIEDHVNFDDLQGSDFFIGLFSCPLGVESIMISINGDIHCCCKTDYSFPLGHVETGIDKEKLIEIYASYYNKINKKCKNCWAFRFCNICPAMTAWNGEFILPNEKECKNIRIIALINLIKYIILTEEYDYIYSNIYTYYKENTLLKTH
jgi:uncharacterized protein